MDFKEAVASELRSLRARVKLTQKEVSERAGVDVGTIVRYENNQISMNLENLEKIIRAYGIDCYIFFDSINAKLHNENNYENNR